MSKAYVYNQKGKRSNLPTEVHQVDYDRIPMANPDGYNGSYDGIMEQMRMDVKQFKSRFKPNKT
jgi:hypothetical protein